MRRTHTLAAAASLTIATAMLLARPALALTLAPRGDIAACDANGDVRREDDCLRHVHRGGTKDGLVPQHGKVSLSLGMHRSMWGSAFTGEVQYRRLNAEGAPIGPWSPMAGFALEPRHTKDGVVDTIHSCAPEYRGTYEMRVALAPTKATGAALRARAGSVLASPASASTAAKAATVGAGAVVTSSPTRVTTTRNVRCSDDPADFANVEYFNMMVFNQGYAIVSTPVGPATAPTGVAMTLSCPTPPASVPLDLTVTMTTLDGSQTTSCGGQPMTFDKASYSTPDHACKPSFRDTCVDVRLTASSTTTGTVYSTTEWMVSLAMSPFTSYPNFEPATVPICNNTFSFGMTSPTDGTVTLVDGLGSPSSPMAYSSNAQAYFQTVIEDGLSAGS